jgi:hypothetical protein
LKFCSLLESCSCRDMVKEESKERRGSINTIAIPLSCES